MRAKRTNVFSLVAFLLAIAAIARGALQGETDYSLGIQMLATYSAAGGFLGASIGLMSLNRTAGAVLASLGTGVTTGFKVITVVVAPIGVFCAMMLATEKRGASTSLISLGQGLLFATFGAWGWQLARTKWLLTERGIVGPNAFLPWRQILGYVWENPNTLSIKTVPSPAGVRQFAVPVAPDARERVAEVLARKLSTPQ